MPPTRSPFITLSFFSFLLVFSCTNKTPIADEPPIPQPDIPAPVIFRYVKTEDGLRIRDAPGLSGTIIGLLPYGEQITEIAIDDKTDMIDGITERWRLIRSNETEGWVFGGYLSHKPPPPALTPDDFGGSYSVQSINITKQIDMDIANFLENVPNFEYTLKRKGQDLYEFTYPDLWFKWYNRHEGYDNVGYKTENVYLPARETYHVHPDLGLYAFFNIWSEGARGGETIFNYYYHDGKIIFDLKCDVLYFSGEGDDIIVSSTESLEFEMILGKK